MRKTILSLLLFTLLLPALVVAQVEKTDDQSQLVPGQSRGFPFMCVNSSDAIDANDFGTVRCGSTRQLMVEAIQSGTWTVTANAGTNLNTSALLTTSAHDAAFGTAGSADAQVRTVQGITSGTPVNVQWTGQTVLAQGIVADGSPVSGFPVRIAGKDGSGNTQDLATDANGEPQVDVVSLPAVTQGSPASAANRWPVTVSDGTNSMPTMDAAARRGYVQVSDGTNSPAVKAASTAAASTDPSLVVQLNPVQPNLTTPLNKNLAQVGGTATVDGGLAGSLSVGGTAATNAAITQKPMLIGAEALSTQPAAATTGNQRQLVSSLDGALYTRQGGPVTWACSLNAIGATLTQCRAAPGAGLRLYITWIWWQSTTTTAGTGAIQYGTGTNCGTGTTALLPASGTSNRYGYPASNSTNATLQFPAGNALTPGVNTAVCVIGVVTNTVRIDMGGYIAP